MGLYFRRRISVAPGMWLNLSKSGISASMKVGRITVNSRRRIWANLGGGWYWRSR